MKQKYHKLSVVAENKFWISDTEGHLVVASQDPYETHSLLEDTYFVQFSIKGEKHKIELNKDLEINESHLQ